MTDVSPTPDLDIDAELAAIRAEIEAEGLAAATAAKSETDRLSAIDTAKARCAAACGKVAEALAAAEDPREREALIGLEARVHAGHAADLEAAYLVFAGQREGGSNPAHAGENALESHVVLNGEVEN